MTRLIINNCCLILFCLLLSACSVSRLLPKGEKLYTGAEIKLESADKLRNKQLMKKIAKNSVRPIPNKSFMGMHPKLWVYLKTNDTPKNKLNKLLGKYGEAPVLISDVKPVVTSAIIDAKFFNVGIFNSYTEYEIVEKEHSAKIIYTSHLQQQYTFKELTYSISDDSISKTILAGKGKSLVLPGEAYNLELLKIERIRIDALLKDKGYFYFNPDYLLFKADTSDSDHAITLKLVLKDSIPRNALIPYRINNVYIDQNYFLNAESDNKEKSFITYQNSLFLGEETKMNIRPSVIFKSVHFKRNEIYSRKNHNITLNRLMSMGNFKFVSVKFAEVDTIPGFLDVSILLTPMSKHTVRAEVDFVSKSNDFMGPRLNVSYLNRNSFKGAELLNLNLSGSYEAQFGKNNLFSYSLSPKAELYFPGLLVPFKIIGTNNLYVPKTRLSLSYNFLKRVNYFDMSTFQFIYGYKWKKNIKIEQELNPINVSYTSLANKSATFTELLEANPFLKKSYEEQFIAGGNYSFTYNEQLGAEKKIQYFFHLTTEISGNAFSLAKVIGGEKLSSENPLKVVGSAYSQYAKISIDGRGYYNFADKNKLAVRVIAGVVKPYGNSSVLPYTKQFFSGGPNSIRAFQINSVGPGNYQQSEGAEGFLQLGGDVKLETNAEYRFNIYSYFKGALFVDAGNVWLLNSNPSNAGSQFMFSKFLNELAVGTGIGLRIDLSFFVLRFDLAIPLRKPWLEENHRWVIDQINFLNSSWRSDNLVLNVAIGYPF